MQRRLVSSPINNSPDDNPQKVRSVRLDDGKGNPNWPREPHDTEWSAFVPSALHSQLMTLDETRDSVQHPKKYMEIYSMWGTNQLGLGVYRVQVRQKQAAATDRECKQILNVHNSHRVDSSIPPLDTHKHQRWLAMIPQAWLAQFFGPSDSLWMSSITIPN